MDWITFALKHWTSDRMNTVTLQLVRDTYTNGTTLGKLYGVNGEYLCETLEDIVRGWGIKHGGTTAIPTTTGGTPYRLTVSISQRFKRKMVMVYTEPNKYEIKKNGIGFKGVRIHGGNTNANTWGCIIVAANRSGKERVQNTREAFVTDYVEKLIKAGKTVELVVENLPQKE